LVGASQLPWLPLRPSSTLSGVLAVGELNFYFFAGFVLVVLPIALVVFK